MSPEVALFLAEHFTELMLGIAAFLTVCIPILASFLPGSRYDSRDKH